MMERVLAARKEKRRVSPREVQSWLSSQDVPRDPAMLDAFYIAVGLRYFRQAEKGDPKVMRIELDGTSKAVPSTDLIEQAIATRETALEAYEYALMDAEERELKPDTRISSDDCKREGGGLGGRPQNGQENGSAKTSLVDLYVARKYKGITPYKFLDTTTLKELLGLDADHERNPMLREKILAARTQNPAEFLACWRALLPGGSNECMTQGEVGKYVGLDKSVIAYAEIGINMPEPRSLYLLAQIFELNTHQFDNKVEPYTRYVQLIIQTRLKIIEQYRAQNETAKLTSEFQNMPREYYREAIRQLLRKLNDPYATPCKDEEAPAWAAFRANWLIL